MNVDVSNIGISKLIETKVISKYSAGYANVVRPLVLILCRMCGYVKTLKNKNNKLMFEN